MSIWYIVDGTKQKEHLEFRIFPWVNICWLPRWRNGKESTCQCRCGFHPGSGRSPCRRQWQPTPVFLAGKSHGERSLVGYSPWDCKESDMTAWLSAQTSVKMKVSGNERSRLLYGLENYWSWQLVSTFSRSFYLDLLNLKRLYRAYWFSLEI